MEVYVQSQATNLDSEITRSCQAIAVGAPARNGTLRFAAQETWQHCVLERACLACCSLGRWRL